MVRLTAISFFWKNANSTQISGRITVTIAASRALIANITPTAPSRYEICHTASIIDHDASDPIRSVSLITREWIYPTLFWLKYENDSVCKWSNAAFRKSRLMLTSILVALDSAT